MSSWKIIIQPTKSGIELRTKSAAGDRSVEALAEYLEEALLKLSKKRA